MICGHFSVVLVAINNSDSTLISTVDVHHVMYVHVHVVGVHVWPSIIMQAMLYDKMCNAVKLMFDPMFLDHKVVYLRILQVHVPLLASASCPGTVVTSI